MVARVVPVGVELGEQYRMGGEALRQGSAHVVLAEPTGGPS
jgi:hypothetical protein